MHILETSVSPRIKLLNSRRSKPGECVLYVMSRDQRVGDNHTLLAAQKHALAKKLPLAVVFCLNPEVGYRSREQYRFMLEGLREVEATLAGFSIPFLMLIGSPFERVAGLAAHVNPDALYFDFNPLRGPRALLQKMQLHFSGAEYAKAAPELYVVDTHNIVPIWEASDKYEIAAYTLRPKIHRRLAEFLVEPEPVVIHPYKWSGNVQPIGALQTLLDHITGALPESGVSLQWSPGETAARAHLERFVREGVLKYARSRNDPIAHSQSDLSPYLHFGHISALRVALRLNFALEKNGHRLHLLSSPKMPKPEDAKSEFASGVDALVEELIVRKELADNFCYFQTRYDSLASAPLWAQASLEKHSLDERPYCYDFEQLCDGKTHDNAWNAAQLQMKQTGKMHGYMRMYWAKKVLEWSPTHPNEGRKIHKTIDSPKVLDNSCGVILPNWHAKYDTFRHNLDQLTGAQWAISVLKFLNDHYSIDGGDPNGYAGILWSVGGVHDRPWVERGIFGSVRYMNYEGLRRKFDITAYEKKFGTHQ